MATETVNVNATAITAAITAEAAARVAGDAASVATASSDATTKANAAQAAAIASASTDATTKANAAQSAAISAAATDATTKANAAQAAAISAAATDATTKANAAQAASQPLTGTLTALANMGVPVCLFGTSGTLTNQLSTLAFFPMSFVYPGPRLDLTGFTEVKFQACVITGSASANTPKIILRYFTSYSTTTTDYLNIGTSEVSCSLTTAGIIETAWVPLAAGAIGTNKFLRLLMSGGDNDKDPVVGLVTAFFR